MEPIITFSIQGSDPALIRRTVGEIFGLAEAPLQSQVADLAEAVVAATPTAATDVTCHEELPAKEAAPKKTRAKKAEPVAEAPAEAGAAPAFLSEAPKPAETKAEPEVDAAKLLEQLRKVASDLLEAKVGMPDITKVIQTFRTVDGKPAVKMSQIAPALLPAAIAALEALRPAK